MPSGDTHLLVIRVHGAPSSGALRGYNPLCDTRAEILSDDRAGGLHVEEERGEGTLGRIGIMLPLLALLLVGGGVGSSSSGLLWALCALVAAEQGRDVSQLGEAGVDLRIGGVVAQHDIGVSDIVARQRLDAAGQGLDGVLEIIEIGDDLFLQVSSRCTK